jgi:hypothetical protein
MRQQIKIIRSEVNRSGGHEDSVNEFLAQPIEIVSVKTNLTHGYATSSYSHKPQLVTIITYKGEK